MPYNNQKIIDEPRALTGKTFSKLTALNAIYRDKTFLYYECLCDCANIIYVAECNLRRGVSTNCGCVAEEAKSRKTEALLAEIDEIKKAAEEKAEAKRQEYEALQAAIAKAAEEKAEAKRQEYEALQAAIAKAAEEKAEAKRVLEENRDDSNRAFDAWRQKMGFSLKETAKALKMPFRFIEMYYLGYDPKNPQWRCNVSPTIRKKYEDYEANLLKNKPQ